MYGAIIGDLIGSIYEYAEYKDTKNKVINTTRRKQSSSEENLLKNECFYSDDTILTIAVLDSILNKTSYEKSIKKYANNTCFYPTPKIEGFEGPFSKRFLKWCSNQEENNSIGNGASMRISPIAYLFNDLDTILKEVEKCTITSHNSIEAITGAKAIASAIYLSRKGFSKEKIKHYIEKNYNYDLDLNLEKLHKEYKFSSITSTSIPQAIFVFLISNSFEETIRNALYIGGDTDTIACIAGSVAEAYYGIDKNLIEKVNKKIPKEFINLLEEGYKHINSKKI